MLLCGGSAAFIAILRQYLPAYFGESLIAITLGLLVGNLVRIPAGVRVGIVWMSRTGLRLAIVLMGARLLFVDVLRGGGIAFALVLVTMSAAGLTVAFLARRAHVPPRLATLLAVGTAVCGNSAIVATAPVIDADEREIAFAVGAITLFGTFAVFIFPLMGHALHLPFWLYGVWTGAAVNDTSQVVAAGLAYGDSALAVATVVKLARNTLMMPILLAIGIYVGHRGGRAHWRGAIRKSVPLFVLGFLGVALLNSLGILPPAVGHAFTFGSRFLMVAALTAIGVSIRIGDLREVGLRPFLVVLGASIVLTLATLVAISMTRGIWESTFHAF
ncbi:MAG: hypothetical protein A2W26_11305 [Acidobacteria bacterium RBG_16_64_8]|nr:MAG: hypothetical protein A2W26_11305 [Acidobacteria bacterium RBG_16_64_8]